MIPRILTIIYGVSVVVRSWWNLPRYIQHYLRRFNTLLYVSSLQFGDPKSRDIFPELWWQVQCWWMHTVGFRMVDNGLFMWLDWTQPMWFENYIQFIKCWTNMKVHVFSQALLLDVLSWAVNNKAAPTLISLGGSDIAAANPMKSLHGSLKSIS